MIFKKSDLRKKLTALALASTAALFTVGSASGFELGYNVYINGEAVGAFKNESSADEVREYIYDNEGIDVSGVKVAFGLVDGFTSVEEAADNYKKNDSRFEKAAVLSVGGKKIFAVSSADEARKIADSLLAKYKEGEYSEVSFSQKVEIADEYVKKGTVSTALEAAELLAGAVSVQTVTRESIYTVEPYGEIEVEDPELYIGERKTVTEGISGEKYVEYTTVKVNGNKIAHYQSGETVITNPVASVVSVGTKENPKGRATGAFANPVSGNLSSYYGARWGRTHKGIDVCAPAGTPIYAADGGTVCYSGWMSGYGNLIQIDHGNGYVTYYAHCTELYASVGDKVAQGDLIAAVGSTGNSTGNHLHFEIRLNGSVLNPLEYVNY